MIAAADGHGGDDYFRSNIGSKIAADCAIKLSRKMIEEIALKKVFDPYENDKVMCQLAKSIISEWNSLVQEHYTKYPFTDHELICVSEKAAKKYRSGKSLEKAYGTTLLFAAVTPRFWFAAQIGDGSIVAFKNKAGYIAVEKDKRCFLNATTSICDFDAIDEFHWHIGDDIPDGVFIGSDGIEDAYPVNDNERYLYAFYSAVAAEYTDTEHISAFLSEFSEKGSGDDCSIAGIFKKYLF